jgi:hypothetical protein
MNPYDDTDLLPLYKILVEDRGLQALINEASRKLQNPLFLLDQTLRLLTEAPPSFFVTNTILQQEAGLGHLLPASIEQIRKSRTLEAIHKSSAPYIWQVPQDLTFAAYPVRHDGIIIAYMILLQSGPVFTQKNMAYLQRIAKIFACELQKDGSPSHKGCRYAAILEDLLTAHSNWQEVASYLEALGYSLHKCITLLTIPLFPEDAPDDFVFLQLGEQIRQILGHGFYLVKNQDLIFLFDAQQSISDFQTKRLEHLLRLNHLDCGISTVHQNLALVPQQCDEARLALKFGKKLSPLQHIFFYTDYQTFHIVSLAQTAINRDTLAGGLITKLVKYDQQNKTALLTTLGTYLLQGQNVPRTAGKLFIHENTLRYRLKKIAELSHADIHTGNMICEIMLCLYAMRLSEKTAGLVASIFAASPAVPEEKSKE